MTTHTIGSGGDYSTLQTWEDACPADLTSPGDIWRGEIKNASDAFTTTSATLLTFAGTTTDATHYKELTCAAGASFADNASVQSNALRYNASNGASISGDGTYHGALFDIQEQYVHLTKLQASAGSGGTTLVANLQERHCTIDRCIFESLNSYGFFSGFGGFGCGYLTITNSLLVDRVGGRASLGSLLPFSNLPLTFVNCTFVVPSDLTANTNVFALSYASGSTVTVENCAFFGFSGSVFSGTVTPAFTTSVTAGTTATGLTSLAYNTTTGSGFQATTDAARDFRIKTTSAMKDAGTTDSTFAATDIAGTARPSGSSYDIGAWEFVAAGGGPVALTGVAGAGAVGTMVPVISPPLTGVSATGAVGTFAPKTSPPLTGVAGAGAAGTLVPNTTIALTGVAAAGAVGSLSPSGDLTLPLTGVAGAGAVGTLAPAVTIALTGVAAAGAVGSLGPATSHPLTGVAATGAVGTLAPAISVPLTGAAATGQVGSVTVFSPDVVVALTGVSAAGQVGNLGAVGGDVFVNPLVFGATRKEHNKWKRKGQHEPLAPLPELETFTDEPPVPEIVAVASMPVPAPAPAPVVSKSALTESVDDIMVYEAVFSLLAKGFFDA